ncbi:S1 family peptidase [Paenibacillus sp. GCM10027627]|uniref:S1 family peptidase n=1 Tax=unclassified Paenibacillus TaxID=185978 RepID=UPI00364536D7
MKKMWVTVILIALMVFQTTVFAQNDSLGESSKEIGSELPLDPKQQNQLKYEKQYLDSIFTIVEKYFGDTEGFHSYGEIYIDNEAEFKFVVAVAKWDDTVASFINDLKQVVPAHLLSVENVKYSKGDLIALQESILAKLKSSHPNFSSLNAVVNSSIKDQKVILSITQPVMFKQEDSISGLLAEYGGLLKVEAGVKSEPAKLRTDEFTALGGGIQITSPGCSTTGTATKDTREFLITAGHCLTNIGGTAYQGGANIGTQHYSAYTNGGTDVGIILLTNKNKKITNQYYYNNVLNAEYGNKYTTTSNVLANQLLCKSGNTTNVTCGNVSNTNGSVTYGSITLSNIIVIYKATGGVVDGGDSGGIVFDAYTTTRLVGIVSGKSLATDTQPDGAWGYITKIGPALTAAGNVTLYTSDTLKNVDPVN